MANQAVKTLGRFRRYTRFDKGIGAQLPDAYRKFYKEWKEMQPAPVHYIHEEGKWKRNEFTGEVHPVQNVPIPLRFPKEADEQLWGGEAIIQGFQKRHELRRRVPHFWFPFLRRSIVYSEILNKHISVIMTDRAMDLINSNHGFDHYLLKTLACDLRSLLALRLKRKILQELCQKCPAYKDDPEKQKEVYNEYKEYLNAFTPEEIKWYGYSFDEACKKIEEEMEAAVEIKPLKHVYRVKLVQELKLEEAQALEDQKSGEPTSWMQKLNPFGKKQET